MESNSKQFEDPRRPIDPSDPYERMAQTLPRLSTHQMDLIRLFGDEIQVPSGLTLFSRGEQNVDFYAIQNGSIEIFETEACGRKQVLSILDDCQFTGELHLFNNRPILVGGRTKRDSLLIRVRRSNFRRMLVAQPELAEIIMRAFLLRRTGFVRHSQAGVLLIGMPRNPDTHRIQQFLMKNYYPYRFFDVTTEAEPSKVLSHFSLTPADLPAVVDAEKLIMKKPDTRAEVQAEKFGAQFAVVREVIKARQNPNETFELTLCDGSQVQTRTVVVASGARYRKLTVPGYEQFEVDALSN